MVRRRELYIGGLKGGLPSCRERAMPLRRGVMGGVVEAADGVGEADFYSARDFFHSPVGPPKFTPQRMQDG
jgi:hypothetical protein